MTEPAHTLSHARLKTLVITGFVGIVALKFSFAYLLDLYSDEIFYWQASTHPALAYSDLPFMAALLAGSGAFLLGNSAFAVRLFFLLMGTAIPLLVYWLAKPLTGRRQAIEAAGLSLCIPLSGFLGLLAVPDVPLLFFGLLFLGHFERAVRAGSTRHWIMAGIAAALGVSTHYRFSLYLLAGFLCLLAFPSLRKYWRTPGLWLAAAILALGLYPIVSFNLSYRLSGLDYHLLERHPWAFQAEGLLHAFKQAFLVTPLLYGALLYTLWYLLRAARAGDPVRGIFATFALCNLGVYLVLAPWADNTRTSIHWPLSGYLPLVIFLPETLRDIHSRLRKRFTARTASRTLTALVSMGFAGTLIALTGIGSQYLQTFAHSPISPAYLSNKMAGWREFNHYLDSVISRQHLDANDIVVTDNFYTAAQIELARPELRPVYNIDEDKAVNDGRAVQYELWQLNGNALKSLAAPSGLFVTEDSTLTVPEKIEVLQRACTYFDRLVFVSQLSLFENKKRFSFYRGDSTTDVRSQVPACPLPSLGWVDQPTDGARIEGELRVAGWVINEGLGVAKVELWIDDEAYGLAQYGGERPDVVDVMQVRSDPNAPNLGFNILVPAGTLNTGRHRVHLKVTGVSGETQIFGERTVDIR